MKFQIDSSPAKSAKAATAYPDLVDVASDLVAKNPKGQEAMAVIDAAQIKANYEDFTKTFPDVKAIIGLESCGNGGHDLAAFLRDLGVGIFSVNNKADIEKMDGSLIIDPAQVAFLNPCKPASQIKYALGQGLKVIGCGSKAEVDKVTKAKRQAKGLTDAIKIILMIDVGRPQPLEELALVLKAARDQGHEAVGVSLYEEERASLEAFTKAVALARLLFEEEGGEGMKVLDLGKLTDEEEDRKRAAVAASQLIGKNKQLMARAADTIISCKSAVGTLVPIQAVKHSHNEKSLLVIKESIYGAFNRILAGQGEPDGDPVLIRKKGGESSKKINRFVRCDVVGCSGEDCDVIKTEAEVEGEAEIGDWLLFPNLLAGSNIHVAFPMTSSSYDVIGTSCVTCDVNMAQLESLYSLPDLTEESLEFMFDI